MASILVVKGPNKGDYYPVQKGRMTVGRLAGCTIQVVDDSVSREHCALEFDKATSKLTVIDRGSSFGVKINTEKVDGQALASDGDEIVIGDSSLLFTTRDFDNRESALKDQHLKRWFGEDNRQTIIR